MTELLEIPQTERERIEEIGAADLVVGIFAPFTAPQFEAAVASVRDSIGWELMESDRFPPSSHCLFTHCFRLSKTRLLASGGLSRRSGKRRLAWE